MFLCTSCESGRSQPQQESTFCAICSNGRVQDSIGASNCVDCSVGTYADFSGLTSCSVCEAGRTQPETGASACNQCPYGKFKNHSGIDDCEPCQPGRFTNSQTDSLSCALCDFGRSQPNISSSVCEDCLAGRYMDHIGSFEACKLCSIGKFSLETSSDCTLCVSKIEFQPLVAQGDCYLCPSNSFAKDDRLSCECAENFLAVSFGDGATFLELDPDGYAAYEAFCTDYECDAAPNPSLPNAYLGFWCAACPPGANCSSRGSRIENVTSIPGFFRGVDGTGTVFFQCLNEACLGGGACQDGYTGLSCIECDSTQERRLVLGADYKCTACPSRLESYGALSCAILLFAFYIFRKIKQKRAQKKPSMFGPFVKIVMTTCQVNSIALTFAFNWSAMMDAYLGAQNQVTSLGTSYLSLACLRDPDKDSKSTFFLETILYATVPLVLVILGGLSALLLAYFHDQPEATAPSEASNGGQQQNELNAIKLTGTRHRFANAWNIAKTSALGIGVIVLYFLQPYIVKSFASIFSCIKMGKDPGDVFFAPDLSIRCWTTREHQFYMISLGIPLFVLYVAGVPLAVYLILSSKQNLEKIRLINGVIYQPGFDVASLDPIDKESQAIKSADSAQDETKRHDQDEPAPIFDPETVAFLENYSFLFFGYSQKCFYWEVVILIRKAIRSMKGWPCVEV